MEFVFDLDDTISVHKNRDFANAEPITATVEKIRALHQGGHGITIFSARGQNSCKGDLELIKERNQKQVEEWLEKHNVPYDRLVFGKPLGDVYVDDKGTSLRDFLDGSYYEMKGNSGAEIFRAGDRVVKKCADPAAEAEWYNKARSIGMKVPRVNSVVLDRIDIEYLEGDAGNKRRLSREDLFAIMGQIMAMSAFDAGAEFDTKKYVEHIKDRLATEDKKRTFTRLLGFITDNAEEIRKRSSFCHGDLSLSNMVFTKDGLYLIDPGKRKDFCTYLMDFAKVSFSLNGGEEFLHGGQRPEEYDKRAAELSYILNRNGIGKLVAALEATHWIRLLNYPGSIGRENEILDRAKAAEALI